MVRAWQLIFWITGIYNYNSVNYNLVDLIKFDILKLILTRAEGVEQMSRQASRGQMSTAYGSILEVWGLTLTYSVEVRPSLNRAFRSSVRCRIFKGLCCIVFSCICVLCMCVRVCVWCMLACICFQKEICQRYLIYFLQLHSSKNYLLYSRVLHLVQFCKTFCRKI